MSNKPWMLRKLAEVSYESVFKERPLEGLSIGTLEAAAKFGSIGLTKTTADKAALGIWKQTWKSGYQDTYHATNAICEALAKGKMSFELRRRIVEFLPGFMRAMINRGVAIYDHELPTPQQIVDWLVECGDQSMTLKNSLRYVRESHYKETLFKTKEQPVATKQEEREVLYADTTGTYKLVRKSSGSCAACDLGRGEDTCDKCPHDNKGNLLCVEYSNTDKRFRVFEKVGA